MLNRKKILFVQPNLQPPGGGNTVAAWIIEALKREYSTSILTWKAPDFEEINRFYGTSLSGSEIRVHYISPIIRELLNLDPDTASFQKMSYLMRVCKRMKKNYDVIISANNEADFGCRGIQYFHYPYLHNKIQPILDFPWYSKLWEMLKGKYRLWMLISGFSYDRFKNNLILVNSDWTGDRVREFYGIEPITVYPPVPGNFSYVPWEEREDGFVCIGRIAPGKGFEKVINILSDVRARGYEVHLHIIGTPDDIWGRDYYQDVLRRIRENPSWVFLNENLSRDELIKLVSKHKYGIHGMVDEHFGIAVAEMVKAGCIAFVPNDGGPVEIVGGDKRLVYQTKEEAITKIIRILSNPDEQASLRNYLNSRKELFSTERFMSQIREIVRRFPGTAPIGSQH